MDIKEYRSALAEILKGRSEEFKIGYLAAFKEIMGSDLADRLNSEEKKRIRCWHKTDTNTIRDHRTRTGDKAQTRATARIKLLERLFGAEVFKPDYYDEK